MTNKKLDDDIEYTSLSDNNNYFYSSDMGLANALITAGYSLVSLDRKNMKKAQFIFCREEGLDEVVKAYWDDELEGKLRTYFDTMKMLKSRLYSE